MWYCTSNHNSILSSQSLSTPLFGFFGLRYASISPSASPVLSRYSTLCAQNGLKTSGYTVRIRSLRLLFQSSQRKKLTTWVIDFMNLTNLRTSIMYSTFIIYACITHRKTFRSQKGWHGISVPLMQRHFKNDESMEDLLPVIDENSASRSTRLSNFRSQ